MIFILFLPTVFTFSLLLPAHAAPVTSLTVQDVGSGGPGGYSSSLDGFSGAFRFSTINDKTYIGASPFSGDIAANPGLAMGEIDTSRANPIQTFTSGFLFANTPFIPKTSGPITADISVVNGTPQMSVFSLPFAGEFGQPGFGTNFELGPQASAPADCAGNPSPWQPMVVQWVNQIDAHHFNYKIGWSHCITVAEDEIFGGTLAYWRLEGVATTAVPLPAALWLLLSGVTGLLALARRRRFTAV
jgi:hypothetical protein